ncbi:MAG: DUF1287 domain-containing protein [Candidatus Riflebacteria bacterium]|nr:DUF1287 domain-containing protein [Candidatus Riflebacteria bacterium]
MVLFKTELLAQDLSDNSDILKLLENCRLQTELTRYYDPAYVKLDYPMGDVDISRGVCTDVVIRAFRAINIDLQKLIHEDMKKNFQEYPRKWNLKKPDTNIDHRRVPNIVTFLKRKNMVKKNSDVEADYLPGDLVTWKLPGNLDHIGVVSNVFVAGTRRYAIYHNIGNGTTLEDILFEFTITGHFSWWN